MDPPSSLPCTALLYKFHREECATNPDHHFTAAHIPEESIVLARAYRIPAGNLLKDVRILDVSMTLGVWEIRQIP